MYEKHCSVVAVASLLAFPAVAQEMPPVAPVHMLYCDLVDGKDMDDVMEVAGEFAEYVEGGPYSAWILTPQFRATEATWQVGWLGSWPNGASMGEGMDGWLTNGGEMASEIAEVMDCKYQALASSMTIHAPDGPPDNGVVSFSSCTLEDEATMADGVAAMGTYDAAMLEMADNGAMSWAFIPTLGMGEVDFDFYHVKAWHKYADFGKGYDAYFNGGGWQAAADASEGVVSCDTPRVYDAHLVVKAGSGDD
jgi:hypothetical protein